MSDGQNYPIATAISGLIGGTIGKLICHPIDTIKAKI